MASSVVMDGFVTVSAGGAPVKQQPSLSDEHVKQQLDALNKLVGKLEGTMAPWTARKYCLRAASGLKALQEELGSYASAHGNTSAEAQKSNATLRMFLEESRRALAVQEAHASELQTQLAERDAKIAALERCNAQTDSRVRELMSRVDSVKLSEGTGPAVSGSGGNSGSSLPNGSAPAPSGPRVVSARIDMGKKPKAAEGQDLESQVANLQARVEALVEEHTALQAKHEKLATAKSELAKKYTELSNKYSNTADVAERELRRLTTEIKRLGEAKDKEVAEVREQLTSEATTKLKDQRTLQRRYDSMKSAAESVKEAQKVLQRQLEEATAALAKSHDDMDAVRSRLAKTEASRDGLASDLDLLRTEHGMLLVDVQDTAATIAPATATPVPLGAATSTSTTAMAALIKPKMLNAALPWPRRAFTAKGGRCLHNHACCATLDSNSMALPFEYSSHRELEAQVAAHGYFLCHTCRVKPGF